MLKCEISAELMERVRAVEEMLQMKNYDYTFEWQMDNQIDYPFLLRNRTCFL